MKYIDKSKVKDALNVIDVIKMYSTKYKAQGRNIFFLCPFHNDQHLGSCWAYNEGSAFKCASCGASGDLFNLAAQYVGIDTRNMNDLLERIVTDFGLSRDSCLADSDVSPTYEMNRIGEELTDDEYTRLAGTTFIINEKNERIYFKSLRKRDFTLYEGELCLRSRQVWQKLYSLSQAVKRDNEKFSNVMKLIELSQFYELSDIIDDDSEIVEVLRKRLSASAILTAIINENDKLLRKTISPERYTQEIQVRKNLKDRERLKKSIINRIKQ